MPRNTKKELYREVLPVTPLNEILNDQTVRAIERYDRLGITSKADSWPQELGQGAQSHRDKYHEGMKASTFKARAKQLQKRMKNVSDVMKLKNQYF